MAMAVATPAMLPVPTRDAVEIIMAWKELTALPSLLCFFSMMCLNMSGMKRSCTKPVRMLK